MARRPRQETAMHHVRALTAALYVLGIAAGLAATGCNPNSIGRPCINPQNSAPGGTQVVSPALECPSRLCLIQPSTATSTQGTSRNTCTASCESDDDCQAETTEYCQRGFVCAVATQVGNFCCKKLCVCRDDLVPGFNVVGEGDTAMTVTPHSCDPSQPGSITMCPNVQSAQ
jgi:hypothetical protein